jgi:predicted  nucleic acid-binding Zn-ribbon protein
LLQIATLQSQKTGLEATLADLQKRHGTLSSQKSQAEKEANELRAKLSAAEKSLKAVEAAREKLVAAHSKEKAGLEKKVYRRHYSSQPNCI